MPRASRAFAALFSHSTRMRGIGPSFVAAATAPSRSDGAAAPALAAAAAACSASALMRACSASASAIASFADKPRRARALMKVRKYT